MRRANFLLLLSLCTLSPHAARAENLGFQLNRHEPTTLGEWSLGVDHPWYSSMRFFAAGLTLNYAHQPLVLGRFDAAADTFQRSQPVIEHQLLGHLDLAGSILDRLTLSLSMPVTLLERGQAINGIAPLEGAAVGDLRFGLYGRLFGQPYAGPVSMSVSLHIFAPLRSFDQQVGDQQVRVLPKLILGGLASGLFWSLTAGFLYREDAVLGRVVNGAVVPAFGNQAGSSTGSEIQLGLALGYASFKARFALVPEILLSSVVTPRQVSGVDELGMPTTLTQERAFKKDFTSLEALIGIHYNIARQVQMSVGGGVGLLRQPGTPDGRVLFRLAYAPVRRMKDPPRDSDRDGVLDTEDLCPEEPMGARPDAARRGCPIGDRDKDYVLDPDDQCPDVPKDPYPDPSRPGCPMPDRDRDGIYDKIDLCPEEPMGPNPDPDRRGCPLSDRDRDGVYDKIDECPDVPRGPSPDPDRRGCPARDRDGDGVFDHIDQCPDMPAGLYPDSVRRGCPLGDMDGDGVFDADDQCPDVPRGPNPDPDRRGCPARDRDGDGVFDHIDQCPDTPPGASPDPSRPGCPNADRDKDTIVDPVDACPDEPGAPHPDPKKNGCPGLVRMAGERLVIMRPVFFATDEDIILPQSYPVLEAVADALKAQVFIRKIRVEGHTDNRGAVAHNTELSDRRARSVRRFLIEKGVEESRIEAQGFGPARPIKPNKSAAGRAANRRVEFIIVDPPYAGPPVDPGKGVSPDDSDAGKKGKKGKAKKGGRKKK